jgi:hypothetical protein
VIGVVVYGLYGASSFLYGFSSKGMRQQVRYWAGGSRGLHAGELHSTCVCAVFLTLLRLCAGLHLITVTHPSFMVLRWYKCSLSPDGKHLLWFCCMSSIYWQTSLASGTQPAAASALLESAPLFAVVTVISAVVLPLLGCGELLHQRHGLLLRGRFRDELPDQVGADGCEVHNEL